MGVLDELLPASVVDDLKAANEAIDPLRDAIIATCKEHGIPRHTAVSALCLLIGIEGGSDGLGFDAFARHAITLIRSGHFVGRVTKPRGRE